MFGAIAATSKAAFEAAPWATTATVIPVLMLALIFNERYFDRFKNESPRGSIFLLSVASSMIVGEVMAVSTLFEAKQPSGTREAVVILAVAMPLLALGVRMIEPRLRVFGEVMSSRAIAVWGFVAIAAVLAFTVCTALGVNTAEWPVYAVLLLFVFASFIGANPNRRRDDKQLTHPSDSHTSDGSREADNPKRRVASRMGPIFSTLIVCLLVVMGFRRRSTSARK
jgi:hypothetical protein